MSMAEETPNIRAVRAEPHRRIVIVWKGGAESTVDLTAFLKEYAIFAPLRKNAAAFGKVKVGEWGWSAHWSDEMEVSADTLRRLALEQGSAWLRQWRTAHRMTQAEAAKELGVSPRMWRYYEAGSHLLPKTVRLAAIGRDAQARAA
jgi:hypothetical protein